MAEYIERKALQTALQRKKSCPANIRYTEGWNDCMMRVKSMESGYTKKRKVAFTSGGVADVAEV